MEWMQNEWHGVECEWSDVCVWSGVTVEWNVSGMECKWSGMCERSRLELFEVE